jgi:prepilin-type processing-associated H-X9-DG protein
MNATPRPRHGLTLVEVLVVTGIVGMMAGLLLSAVQYVRATAQRAQCANNLKQIGLALMNYHDVRGVMPPGIINSGCSDRGQDTRSYYPGRYTIYNHTGFTLLLPFIEQEGAYNKYDFSKPSCNAVQGEPAIDFGFSPLSPSADLANFPDGVNDTPNADIVGTYIPVYACPSETRADPDNVAGYGPLAETNARRSSYLFSSYNSNEYNSGYPPPFKETGDKSARSGMFGTNASAKLVDVKDGTSNTLMVGESRQQLCNSLWGPHWGVGMASSVFGWVVDDRFVINFRGGTDPTICPDTPPERKNYPGPWTFSSYHTGGANFVFADGSVHFLTDRLTIDSLKALATIDGDENPPGDP